MAVIENRVHIRRPRQAVFDYLVDLSNELKWNPDVESMEKISEGPVRLSTQYRAKWKMSGVIICECTRFDPPNGWSYRNGGPVAVDLDISLSDRDGGTDLVSRFDARPKGWFRLAFPIFLLILRKTERDNMANAKRAMETT